MILQGIRTKIHRAARLVQKIQPMPILILLQVSGGGFLSVKHVGSDACILMKWLQCLWLNQPSLYCGRHHTLAALAATTVNCRRYHESASVSAVWLIRVQKTVDSAQNRIGFF